MDYQLIDENTQPQWFVSKEELAALQFKEGESSAERWRKRVARHAVQTAMAEAKGVFDEAKG